MKLHLPATWAGHFVILCSYTREQRFFPSWQKDALLGDSSVPSFSADFLEVAMKSVALCFPLSSGICSPSALGIEIFPFKKGWVCSPLYLWVGGRKPRACFHGFAAEALSRTGKQAPLCFFFSCAGPLHKQQAFCWCKTERRKALWW